ncbi:MAG: UDP-glucose 4-epimerase GalE [Methylovulum sp.]|uniref:UDP-glucose 4-epimerase GalE n=1 Tax=Methylovulum sp. TaxID=1916980 RepID=UPI002613C236|nr:UDP-glucose 4-epimerase GalE [Methylovulum sp.]MDD2724684.1 UDP-glucose 4-epimerase GalE [Methylovulum sp.]
MAKKKILVTGGAGYIGSHACVELTQAGYEMVVVDNLSNSKTQSLVRVEQITGKPVTFYQADIRDKAALTDIFVKEAIDTVIHFAGLKAVGESCAKPQLYYHNNVYGTLVLTEVMAAAGVKQLVFSSSATVYGESTCPQYSEDFPLGPINPYGRSKTMIEDILRDLSRADAINQVQTPWKIALLRYFNPIGAHASGLIGEDPNGIPNNLMPYIAQVAVGKLKQVSVFGNDYPTPDGTGIRDYIHVVDLVKGHIKAIEILDSDAFAAGACKPYNLGTGRGYSVLEMIQAFERVTGRTVNYQIVGRRAGDLAECFANPDLAFKELGWKAEKNLDDMVADTWNWQSNNPQGYE